MLSCNCTATIATAGSMGVRENAHATSLFSREFAQSRTQVTTHACTCRRFSQSQPPSTCRTASSFASTLASACRRASWLGTMCGATVGGEWGMCGETPMSARDSLPLGSSLSPTTPVCQSSVAGSQRTLPSTSRMERRRVAGTLLK
jgi:hypothetical protein